MITKCPTQDELLDAALGRNSNAHRTGIARHIESCDACRQLIRDNRAVAAQFHTVPLTPVPGVCLNDDGIAELAGGDCATAEGHATAHVAACPNCRARLADIVRLMEHATIRSEIRALETPQRFWSPRWSRRQLTMSGGVLAAATAAIVLLGPVRSGIELENAPHRDRALTATIAPRIVSRDFIAPADSLLWTSVPQADLYRVRIWNSEGTVVWNTETRDTTVGLPQIVQSGGEYMAEVSARTGWDRWASSDLVELGPGAHRAR